MMCRVLTLRWYLIISVIWGNLRWSGLGFGFLYDDNQKEPENMKWVGQYSNANMVKTDFFEAKSTAYAKSTALIDDL